MMATKPHTQLDRLMLTVAALLVLVLVGLLLTGKGPAADRCGACGSLTAGAKVSGLGVKSPGQTVSPAAATASVTVLPSAKLFFESGKADLPTTATQELAAVVAYLKQNPGAGATISGYHDPTGNRSANEELAKNRAKGVRDALVRDGIDSQRLQMAKPIETTGSGDPRQARRVEITVVR